MTDLVQRRLAEDLHRVAAITAIPPPPSLDAQGTDRPGKRSARRKGLVVTAVTAAGLAITVPVTAAAGGLSAISIAFGWTHQPTPRAAAPAIGNVPTGTTIPALPIISANNATGKYVLTVPGPPGHTMQVWEADASGGGQCVSLLEPADGGFESLGGECTAATPTTVGFGAGGTIAGGWITDLYAPPGATYLTLDDGLTTRKIPAAEGLSAAWLPPVDQGRSITLTAYNATGNALAQTTASGVYVTPWPIGPKHPGCHSAPGNLLVCPSTGSQGPTVTY